MVDQTHGAVDSLLGLLSGAIKDEARLLGGVHGDMQFIKDEMDSMNGFLLHLTKTESDHDDQLRAWMKQVRDIAYIAQDCIELYMRDLAPLQEPGLWALLRRLPKLLWTTPSRHRLATKIRELKVRVRDVGERRQRYDVSIRSTEPRQEPPAGQGGDEEEARRAAFLNVLLGPHGDGHDIDKAIDLLPRHLRTSDADDAIRAIVKRCGTSKEMFLRALYAHPHGTEKEMVNLKNKKTGEEDLEKAVMIFCYSKLSTHYKSCLQYLTAFQKEDSISRTSMVRRWLAEGLVAREEGLQSLEKAAEHCFRELMFRGFIRPFQTGADGKVKSCKMDKAIWKFVVDISKADNFVGGNNLLPYHLQNQVTIRDIVRKQQAARTTRPAADTDTDSGWAGMITACCLCTTEVISRTTTTVAQAEEKKDDLVEIVNLLKNLQLNSLYRLNVLDLGGCKGLRKRHLKIICRVLWLKYLSLRDTDVSVLPSQINNLQLLETLDVRQTDVRATGNIFLPKLKHLLAGRAYRVAPIADESSLTNVQMPHKIAAMRQMEILSHVQINYGGTDQLDLPHLRKLGVLLTGSEAKTLSRLRQTVSKLSGSLISLSISINNSSEPPNMDMENTIPLPKSLESLHINGVLGYNGLPNWCHNLNMLSKVTLCETALPVQSLRILGKLQALCCLRLRHHSFVDITLTFSADEFHSLKFLLMEDIKITKIEFQSSAVPKLERITWWSFTDTTTDVTSFSDFLCGINELPLLKLVEFNPGHRCLKLPKQGSLRG